MSLALLTASPLDWVLKSALLHCPTYFRRTTHCGNSTWCVNISTTLQRRTAGGPSGLILLIANLSLNLSLVGAPWLSLQFSGPVPKQRLVDDQRVQTGRFLWCPLLWLPRQFQTALSVVSQPRPSCAALGVVISVLARACVACDAVTLSRLRSLLPMSTRGHEMARGSTQLGYHVEGLCLLCLLKK